MKGIGEKNLSSCSWTVANSASSIMDSKPGTRIGTSLGYYVLFSNYGDPGHAIFVAYIWYQSLPSIRIETCILEPFFFVLFECFCPVSKFFIR